MFAVNNFFDFDKINSLARRKERLVKTYSSKLSARPTNLLLAGCCALD